MVGYFDCSLTSSLTSYHRNVKSQRSKVKGKILLVSNTEVDKLKVKSQM